jgi:hypothetical protein
MCEAYEGVIILVDRQSGKSVKIGSRGVIQTAYLKWIGQCVDLPPLYG